MVGKKGDVPGPLLKLRALSDQTRLDIINLLSSGPLCACDILESFQITQPTLSYHMKLLTSSGLVSLEKKGKWTYYSLDKEKLVELMDYLYLMYNTQNVPLVKSNENCADGCT